VNKCIKFLAAAALSFALTGCSSNATLSTDAACKEYFNQYKTFLTAVMTGDATAATKYTAALKSLADKSPSDLAADFRKDADGPGSSFTASTICAPYLTQK
jgi:hypothetical protein